MSCANRDRSELRIKKKVTLQGGQNFGHVEHLDFWIRVSRLVRMLMRVGGASESLRVSRRPNFEHGRVVQGYIKGWRRVWWQGSTGRCRGFGCVCLINIIERSHERSADHRGTPERPGRTVTLHQDPEAITWGVAYELAGSPDHQMETLKVALDHGCHQNFSWPSRFAFDHYYFFTHA